MSGPIVDWSRSLPPWLPLSVPVVIAAAAVVLYWGYRLILPKPLPGIPYNKGLGIMGDLPELIKYRRTQPNFRRFFGELCLRHDSPMVQAFLRPLAKPVVVLTDYRESQDITLRRAKQFDRSKMHADAFGTVLPDHHISMRSWDPRFRENRELVKDLMTPAFLNQVSAPSIYEQALQLVRLWELKSDVAAGRPFAAFADIHESALDIILAVAFGPSEHLNIIKNQLAAIEKAQRPSAPAAADEPFAFPHAPLQDEVQAFLTVVETLAVSMQSPVPKLHHWFLRKTKWRNEFATKERVLRHEIRKAVERLATSESNDEEATKCAMDHMILRERAAAKKAGRKPEFDTPRMRDELFGYLVGGHDTSGTTLSWVVKFLADNPHAQATLRRQLRTAYAAAHAEGRQPSVVEITKTSAPYLDAFVEESARVAPTLPIIIREAVVDTTVLGKPIPKGTSVVMYTNGPSYVFPGVPVAEELRSESSRAARQRVGVWDDETMARFTPERWLKNKDPAEAGGGANEFDSVEFDAQSGPMLTFGAGPRGCFGRRLAYLEIRLVTALLVWNFEFEKCPEALSSYNAKDILTTMPRKCFVKLRRV